MEQSPFPDEPRTVSGLLPGAVRHIRSNLIMSLSQRLAERRAMARRVQDRVTDPCLSCGQPNHRVVTARIRQQAESVMEVRRTSSGPSLAELLIAIAIVVAAVVALIQVPWDQVLR